MDSETLNKPLKKLLYINESISHVTEAEQPIQDLKKSVPCEIEWVPDALSGVWSIQKNVYDVCILEYSDSKKTDFELLKELKETRASTPVVLYTSDNPNEIGEKVFSAGASDVIYKKSVDKYLLEKSIRYTLSLGAIRSNPSSSDAEKIKWQNHMGFETAELAQNLNNLLSIISGASQILETKMNPADPLLKHPKQIMHAAESAAQITQRLLAQSRAQLLEPEWLDLNAVIYEMESMLVSLLDSSVNLVLYLNPGIHAIKADRGQLGQMIYNLLLSVSQSIDVKGKISLSTRNDVRKLHQTDADDLSDTLQKFVALVISFSGVGLSEQDKQSLLAPFKFEQNSNEPFSLGMPTVRLILQNMGGEMEVVSDRDGEFEIKLFFPMEKTTLRNTTIKTPVVEGEISTQNILVVDDESSIRSLLRETLQIEGYHILEAKNAEEALRYFKDKTNKIDLLLTDVVLPLYSGPELALSVSKISPDTRVCFISAHTNEKIVRHQFHVEPDGFLQKPFSLDELVRMVNIILADKKRS